MLFHVGLSSSKDKPDLFLRSSLISALYSFATQVENDTIDVLRMGKVSLLFNKQQKLIFILVLDATIDPGWCKHEIIDLQREFFKQFPSVQWQQETVLDLSLFESYRELATTRLRTLNKRVKLLKLLLDEQLIKEEDYPQIGFDCLGNIVAGRLLEKYHNQLIAARAQSSKLLYIVDKFLNWLEGSHVARSGMSYLLDCHACALCQVETECFFLTFLETVSAYLGFDIVIRQPQTFQRYLSLTEY
jgi:hypothetical protein